MNKIVAPSLLAADFLNLEKDLVKLNDSNAQWIHLDVMDGVFVPNLTFGYDLITKIRAKTTKFLDVHLMISNPQTYIDQYIKAGADMLTFHYETVDQNMINEMINKIKQQGCKVGITINPGTSIEVLDEFLPNVDMVLVMSVNPGFGGQVFIESSLEKIKYLNTKREKKNYKFLIEVDGGVNEQNHQKIKDSGCDVLVAGSYLFGKNMVQNIKILGE